MDIFAA